MEQLLQQASHEMGPSGQAWGMFVSLDDEKRTIRIEYPDGDAEEFSWNEVDGLIRNWTTMRDTSAVPRRIAEMMIAMLCDVGKKVAAKSV